MAKNITRFVDEGGEFIDPAKVTQLCETSMRADPETAAAVEMCCARDPLVEHFKEFRDTVFKTSNGSYTLLVGGPMELVRQGVLKRQEIIIKHHADDLRMIRLKHETELAAMLAAQDTIEDIISLKLRILDQEGERRDTEVADLLYELVGKGYAKEHGKIVAPAKARSILRGDSQVAEDVAAAADDDEDEQIV